MKLYKIKCKICRNPIVVKKKYLKDKYARMCLECQIRWDDNIKAMKEILEV